MKNTLALGAILFGAIVVYGGYKNWTIADTIRFFTGQEMHGDVPGVVKGTPQSGKNPGDKDIGDMPDPPAGYRWTGKDDGQGRWGYVLEQVDPSNPDTPAIPQEDGRNEPGRPWNIGNTDGRTSRDGGGGGTF